MKYFEQGRALVIGVGTYSDSRWNAPTALRDAQGCYDALVDPNGASYARSEVELVRDTQATREGVHKAFKRLADRCTPETIVFISITSHGALGDDGLYYLATSDTQFTTTPNECIRGRTGFSVADLARALHAIPARQVLVVVNACFAGHLGPRLAQGPIKLSPGIALPDEASKEILATGEGRAIISASKPDQHSHFMIDDDHSYFGQALIQALKGGPESERSGYVGLYELYETIYRQVQSAAAQAHHVQEPTLTLVQGVGPFPVAAYPYTTRYDMRISQVPPQNTSVREVSQHLDRRTATNSFDTKAQPNPLNPSRNSGLPTSTLVRLRQILSRCDEFSSHAQLRALFVDESLRPWQNGLPEADSIGARVALTIDYLHTKKRTGSEYGLPLLLKAMLHHYDHDDERFHALHEMYSQLANTQP